MAVNSFKIMNFRFIIMKKFDIDNLKMYDWLNLNNHIEIKTNKNNMEHLKQKMSRLSVDSTFFFDSIVECRLNFILQEELNLICFVKYISTR